MRWIEWSSNTRTVEKVYVVFHELEGLKKKQLNI